MVSVLSVDSVFCAAKYIVLFLGIISEEILFQFCKPFLCCNHTECLELLTVYDIIMKVGESSYFVPALLPSNISHLPEKMVTVGNCAIHEHHQTRLTGVGVKQISQEDTVDDQHSSDEDDGADYIVDLVDRANKDGMHLHHRLVHSTKEQRQIRSPAVTLENHSLPNGNNFYNVDLMNSFSFEKSTASLLQYDSKDTCAIPTINNKSSETDFYPMLCRIWFSPFIPDGFWPRLLSRIVSHNDINDILLKLLPTIEHSQRYSLWSLWQSGVAIIHNNIVMLELKKETNFTMDEDNNLVIQYAQYRIFLSINTNEFIMLHSSGHNQECSLSHEEVFSLTTKLLVLIELLLHELEEWFPGAIEQSISGEVISYVPCYHCIHQGVLAKQFSYTKGIVLYHSSLKHNVHCFSVEQMLYLYSDNKSPVCQHHGKMFIEFCVPDIVSTCTLLVGDENNLFLCSYLRIYKILCVVLIYHFISIKIKFLEEVGLPLCLEEK